MQKISTCLWFDDQAEGAAKFYTSIFKNSKILATAKYPKAAEGVSGKKAGSVMTVEFEIEGQRFMGLNGGPIFQTNPSISFFLNFDPSKDKNARENLDATWEKLSEGGKALMPLDKYPFSEHYGWIQDKFGVSWQLILTDPKGEVRPFIVPSFLFTGSVAGKANEAIDLYVSVFKNSRRGISAPYPKGSEPDKEGTLMFADFMLEGQWFAAMDSAHDHKFAFSEGVSLVIHCDSQKEVDAFWEKLTANGGEESQCGWLKDKFGVSWQVTPAEMNDIMNFQDPVKAERTMAAMLKMKKLDIARLKEAANG